MSAVTLAAATLARQFPADIGRDDNSAVGLIGRIGPIQSQVPRAPFLGITARLPGIDRSDLHDALAGFDLMKGSNLRGTVHVSTRQQFAWLDAVSRPERAKLVRRLLKPERTTPAELAEAVESICADGWIERSDLIARTRDWLARSDSAAAAERLRGSQAESLIWGHSGLCRQPRDGRWDRRTDVLHRTARDAVSDGPGSDRPGSDGPASDGSIGAIETGRALDALVRVHLGAYGPARIVDVAWWLGVGLIPVRQSLNRLGEEVIRMTGPSGEELLDLAEPPPLDGGDPGIRLLPEFDALTIAYRADGRNRFLDTDQVAGVWAATNGQVSPVVLHRGRLVARWRTVKGTGGLRIQVIPFARGHGLTEADLDGAAHDVGRALAQSIQDCSVTDPSLGPIDSMRP